MWGLFAALALEGLDLLGAVRRAGGPPWRGVGEPGVAPYAMSAVVRCLCGAGLAAGLAAAGQVSAVGAAVAAGVAAPLLLTQVVRLARPAVHGVAVAPASVFHGPARPSRLRVKLPAARKKTGDDHRAG